MSETCMFCDRPATRLCDEALALVAGGVAFDKYKRPYVISTIEAMVSGSYTCDAPCCADHAKVVGFYCAGKESDTIDHCAGCLRDPPKHHKPLSLEIIATIRRERHAKWRRERFASVPETTEGAER